MTARPLLQLNLFVLLGAVLLFGMEPLVGRLLLPSFGGSFHVWATCLMVFQGSLFLGYLYCHALGPRLGRWHLLVAALPLLFLPIGRGLWGAQPDPDAPLRSILAVLGAGIVLPFTVVATTGVMAQRWLADSTLPERGEPYRLYAASNAGSLLALLGYPLLVEPFLGLETQRWAWSALYLVYLALAALALRLPRADASAPAPAAEPSADAGQAPPRARDFLAWALLSAAPSACLMAVTNVIAMDLGSVPLVWVVPLSLYLLTFIVVFGRRSYEPTLVRRFWPELAAGGLLLWTAEHSLTWGSALVHLLVLLVVCWAAHAELYRRRPAPAHLTSYYLVLSLGGWLGGVFVSLGAPVLFDSLAEYPVTIGVLALTMLALNGLGARRERARLGLRLAVSASVLALLAVPAAQAIAARRALDPIAVRNFYGIYRVVDGSERVRLASGQEVVVPLRYLTHGSTIHGKEARVPEAQGVPIGFFHAASPLGELLRRAPRPLRVAIVGLGTGALAGHLRPGDEVVYYELDPLVERLATEHFTYLAKTPARWSVVPGDARLELVDAPPASYDLILVDAFSSDAIPTHLLTREALELYRARLRPGGLLAFHISTRYYDLRPVLHATGAALDPPLVGAFKSRVTGLESLEDPCRAFVLAADDAALAPFLARGWTAAADADLVEVASWTDDYANLLAALWARTVRPEDR